MKASVSAASAIVGGLSPALNYGEGTFAAAVGRGPVPRLVAESALFRFRRRVCPADINIDFHAGIFLKERAEWGCVRDGVSSEF